MADDMDINFETIRPNLNRPNENRIHDVEGY